MTRPHRKIVHTTLLALSSFTLSLALGEGALRLLDFEFRLFPTRVEFGWPDPQTLEDQYVPDQDLLWVPKNYYENIATMRRDRPHIVFMGDSCTAWGFYDKLFKELIDQRHPERNLRYANTGVAGWSSYQGRVQFERDIASFAPRVVTLYFGWNDHWASFGIEDKAVGRFNRNRSASAMALADLRLVQLFNFFNIKLYGAGDVQQRPPRVSPGDFAANLSHVVRLARERDIVPVLLTAPSSHTPGAEPAYLAERWLNDLSELVPLHRRYAEIVRQVAAEEDVLVVDLLAAFDRLPPDEVKQSYFHTDGIHLTGDGHKVISLVLYRYFEESGLLQHLLQ